MKWPCDNTQTSISPWGGGSSPIGSYRRTFSYLPLSWPPFIFLTSSRLSVDRTSSRGGRINHEAESKNATPTVWSHTHKKSKCDDADVCLLSRVEPHSPSRYNLSKWKTLWIFLKALDSTVTTAVHWRWHPSALNNYQALVIVLEPPVCSLSSDWQKRTDGFLI